MSGADREEWQAMLNVDPELREAWNGFEEQLARDAAAIKQGARPTGQALGAAARRIYEAAGLPSNND